MAASFTDSDLECPVCHENLKEPKILPCTHLTCKSCLLTWLTQAGEQGGCPLCHAPVVTCTDDLESEVDALPTNLAIMSLLESHQILQTPHVCNICEDGSASSYCMECDIKLCLSCLKVHKRFPSFKMHKTEELSQLTVQRLAERNRFICKFHHDKAAELFCSNHQELICILCGTTRHEGCVGKKMVDDVVEEKRAELKQRANNLREEDDQLEKQIQNVKDTFKVMRQTTKVTFDNLQQLVEDRRRQVETDIQMHEESAMTFLRSLETSRAALSTNAATVESLLKNASGAALLGMTGSLLARLDTVDKQTLGLNRDFDSMQLMIQSHTLQTLEDALAELGYVGQIPECTAINSTELEEQNFSCLDHDWDSEERMCAAIESDEGSTKDDY